MTFKELKDILNKMDDFTLQQEAKISQDCLRIVDIKVSPKNGLVWLVGSDEWPPEMNE